MAAGKNQPQPVVLQAFVLIGRACRASRVPLRFEMPRQIVLRRIKPRAPPQRIDRLESRRRNQPRPRILRNARLRPSLQRNRKRFMHRLFGQIEIAQQTHQGRQHPPRLRPVKCLDRRTNLFRRQRRHPRQTNKRRRPAQLRLIASRTVSQPLLLEFRCWRAEQMLGSLHDAKNPLRSRPPFDLYRTSFRRRSIEHARASPTRRSRLR